MKYAIVENSKVTNLVVADYPFEDNWVELENESRVEIGDSYDGTEFSKPVIVPVVVIPQVISMRQARLALLQAGLLGSVESGIAALSSPTKEIASIEWEYATEVKRTNTFVKVLGQTLNLNETQIDQLFILADTL